MKAVILLGHGSRVPGAGQNMEIIANALQEKYAVDLVKSCYLSRLGPNYPEILEECVTQGANEIIVIPYFLNMGIHIRMDIPKMMQVEAEKYPDIKIIYGRHLGYDDSLADLVYKRVEESYPLPDVRNIKLPLTDPV